MAKLDRVTAKVFAASAAADEIGQFGSAVAGSKLETADVATIQALSAWLDGWSEALVSGNRYPALQEMNGLLKVLSYQGAYALQEGVPEYDSATTYYIGSIVKKTGTFEIYGSLVDNNVGNALVDGTNWKFLVNLSNFGYTADTSNMPTLANNVSDANNDIDFSAGFCYDLLTNVKITNIALTKRLDAIFVEGTNQGGLDTGIKAISTLYACFAISKADGTSDFLFSISESSPTMPSGYINKRRIGWIQTNSSGNIIGFYQKGDVITYNSSITAFTTTSASFNQTLILPVPPKVRAILNGEFNQSSNTAFCKLNLVDLNNNMQIAFMSSAYGSDMRVVAEINANSSKSIGINGTTSGGTQYIYTLGYIDLRGKN